MVLRNGGMWGNNGDCSYSNSQAINETQRQITGLQNQMLDNHNSDLIMAGIKGNEGAVREASLKMNCDFNALNGAIQNVRHSVDNVAAQTGFSAERVINAVNSGDSGVIQAVKDCCCGTQKAIIEQGYQNQLANCQQTNTITNSTTNSNYQMLDRLRDIGNGISSGFASVAYEEQRGRGEIINAINASQQRTADLLNSHWKDELAGELADAKFQVSQLKQNQYIAGLIANGSTGCPNCGC